MKNSVKPNGISFKEYISKVKSTIKLNNKRLRSGLTILKSLDIDGYRIIIPSSLNATDQSLKDPEFCKLIGSYQCSIDRDDDTLVWLNPEKSDCIDSSAIKF